MTQAEIARRCGVSWQAAHGWVTDASAPKVEHLRRIAGECGVTLDELLGVAAGQDPPFLAWAEFIATPEGASIDAGERRALQSLAWPPGREPTVASYLIALQAVRSSRQR